MSQDVTATAPVKKMSRRAALLALLDPSNRASVEADLESFIGPKSEVYLTHFRRLATKRKLVAFSWHWPFFLAGGYPWLAYRRMYGTAVLLFVLPYVPQGLAQLGVSMTGSGIAGAFLALTMMMRSLYISHGFGQILKADKQGLTGEERRNFLARKGNPSLVAGACASVLFVLQMIAVIYVAFQEHVAEAAS